jgi:hypothetical protein
MSTGVGLPQCDAAQVREMNARAREPRRGDAVIASTDSYLKGASRPIVARRYVRSSSPSALAGSREAVPHTGISLTIAEPANQVVRPAYAKLNEGCSEWAEPSLNA